MSEMNQILAGISSQSFTTAAVTEYAMVTPRVAKVIATVAGDRRRDAVFSALKHTLGNNVTPVQASFRSLTDNAIVGFVASCSETRLVEPQVIKANYHVVEANLLMSTADKTLWEVRDSSAGKYLCRREQDNLADLIDVVKASYRGNAPRMAQLASAAARPSQLLAFVSADSLSTPSVDYGFVVASSADGASHTVVIEGHSTPISVNNQLVVGTYTVDTSKASNKLPVLSAKFSTADSIEYYKKLYSYGPEYLKLVIKEVEQMASA